VLKYNIFIYFIFHHFGQLTNQRLGNTDWEIPTFNKISFKIGVGQYKFFPKLLSLHFILCFRNNQANVHVNLDWNIALNSPQKSSCIMDN